MRIACPTCHTIYEVPDAALTPGRTLRCARCQTEWAAVTPQHAAPQPRREEPEPLDPPDNGDPREDAVPVPTAMDRLAAHDQPRSGGKALAAAWALTAVVLIGLLAAGVVGRRAVMAAWPPSMRLYGLIGLSGAAAEAPEAPHAEPKG